MDENQFRQVLGQYPTGVVVITAVDPAGEPIGMTVGSFTSVSLDPPLVAFLPSKTSQSWQTLQESSDRFCVNILSAEQEDVCRAVATRKTDKFSDIPWRRSAGGNPVVEGAVAYIDCLIERIHDAGDHVIVIGRVEDLAVESASYPLLFFRSGYGSFRTRSLAVSGADLLLELRDIDQVRSSMEELAAHFDAEVTAVVLRDDELVLAAAAGRSTSPITPTRVGQRFPFVAPIGAVYAAWGDFALRDTWVRDLHASVPPDQVAQLLRMADRVRRDGYSVALGHASIARIESAATRLRDGDAEMTEEAFRAAIRESVACYNPEIDGMTEFELRSVSSPVFNADGQVAFILTLWCPREQVSRPELNAYVDRLRATARRATATIGGTEP